MKKIYWQFKNSSEEYNLLYEEGNYILVQSEESKKYSFGFKDEFGSFWGFPVNQSCLSKNECIDILNRFIEIEKRYLGLTPSAEANIKHYEDMKITLKKYSEVK